MDGVTNDGISGIMEYVLFLNDFFLWGLLLILVQYN